MTKLHMRPTLRLAFARTGGRTDRLRGRVYKLLLACGPNQPSKFLFAYSYHDEANYKGDWGWALTDPRPDMARFGVPAEGNGLWRITHANKDFQLCDTYLQLLKLQMPNSNWPRLIEGVVGSSGTRPSVDPPSDEGFYYKVSRSHSPEDVKLVTSILAASPGATELLIMDARPLANARANVVMGAGYEHVSRYTNCRLDFMGIPNIHVVRDSWLRLKELLTDETKKLDDNRWRSSLESTCWHQYIGMILSASCKLADAVESGVSVLTHCSDGWDRTSQLAALALVMMDGTYRTLRGFAQLVERQWIDFGHKFALRHGHAGSRSHQLLPSSTSSSTQTSSLESEPNAVSSEWSPIFVQFLDCVWQITRQFPCSFEFNDTFLQFVADQSYACRFGTFLANNRREQVTMCLAETTASLWAHVAQQQEEFTNPLYNPIGPRYLKVHVGQPGLALWPYYTRHIVGGPPHPDREANARIVDITKRAKTALDRTQTLEAELASCTKRLMELLTTDPLEPSTPTNQRKKLFEDDVG